jgi:DNA replication and repair protein RecF
LQQRNVLLKNEESLIDFTLLDLWEEQMAEAGTFIYNKRKEFIEEFTPIFNQFYANISQSGEQVSFSYTSQLDGGYSP